MVDTNIIMAAGQQTPDLMQTVGGGLQFGQGLKNLLISKQLKNIAASTNDPAQQMEMAKNSFYGSDLLAALKGSQQQQAAQALANQKTQSEIYKNMGAGATDYAKAGQTNQTTGAARVAASMPIFQALARTGDLSQAGRMIDMFEKNGTLDAPTAQSYREQSAGLTGQTPEQIKAYGFNLVKSILDPKYNYTTADNVLTNETTRQGQQSVANTALAGQENQRQIAASNNSSQDSRIIKTETAPDGTLYGIRADGKVEVSKTANGQPIKVQPKGGNPKLSDNALKQVNEASSQLEQSKQSASKIGGLLSQLDNGTLQISPTNIANAKIRSWAGLTTDNDLAIDKLKTAINEGVNNILMQAKGTQTEGDAQRAAQVIAANPIHDKNSAIQALKTLKAVQDSHVNSLNQNIDTVYNNYGIARPNQQQPTPPKDDNQEKPPKITVNKGDFMTLASVKAAAKQAGISTEEAISRLQKQGVTIR